MSAPTPQPDAELAPDYTRDDLIAICERAFVPHAAWRNRDTSGAQRQLGECYALLRAGCDFIVVRSGHFAPDDRTIWVEITWKGFGYFDYGGEWENDMYYLPAPARLDRANGKDWY